MTAPQFSDRRAPEAVRIQPYMTEELQLRMTVDLKLQIEQARVSLIHFFHLVFTTEMGEPVIIEPFHHDWAKVLQDEKLLEVYIEGARESTKTTMLMAACLFWIGRNPNIRILWVSENSDAAEKRIATLTHYIKNSALYHLVFPEVKLVDKNDKRKNNQATINIVRDAESQDDTIRGVGVLSPGTGSRSDVLVLDDAVGMTNAVTNPANKPRVLQKILSDWMGTVSRLNGRIVAAFNPWADDDAMSYLKSRTNGFYKVYAHGVKGDPYFPFCPKLWTRQALIDRRRRLGEIVYLRSYCCQTRPRGKRDVIVHPDHLRSIPAQLLTQNVLPYCRALVSADPASGRSAEDKQHQGVLDYNGISIFLYLLRDDLLIDPTGPNAPENHRTALTPELQYHLDHLETIIFLIDCFRFRSSQEEQARILWHLAASFGAGDILAETVGLAALHTILELTRTTLPINLQAQVQQVQVQSIPVGNRSKGDRLLASMPYLNPPPPTPPAIYFHPRSIPYDPDEVEGGFIQIAGEDIQVERTLRRELLDFPQKNDDAMDSYTQGVNYIAYSNPPFIEEEDNERTQGLTMSVISLG